MAGTEVLFVGSVPMANAREVMSALGRRFAGSLKRIPDGETGERLKWVAWQEHVFDGHPQFEAVPFDGDWRTKTAGWAYNKQYRMKDGVTPDQLKFGPMGYAQAARESYADLAELKRSGVIAPDARFMVAVPAPYNMMSWCVTPAQRAVVEPAFEKQLLAEILSIRDFVPPQELSIQWDSAHDMQAFEGAREAWFSPVKDGVIERLVRIGNAIPEPVELGFHLCYGTFGGKHFVEPKTMGPMVDLLNGFMAGLKRHAAFVHMPVPIERDDEAYFAPLAGLKLQPGTTAFLGLIHDQDGVAGNMKRATVARKYLPEFGVAMECGFGRRPPETIGAILDVHAATLQKMDAPAA